MSPDEPPQADKIDKNLSLLLIYFKIILKIHYNHLFDLHLCI